MKSDPPADPTQLLRQQLILAQVRLMELEDTRDELAPRLAEAEQLFAAAQLLADRKADETAHLGRVLADLQAQANHLRHVQHETHLALEETRARLAALQQELDGTRLALETGRQVQADQQLKLAQAGQSLLALREELHQAHATAAQHARRIGELDQERAAMKASRSWRWTAWLRAVERKFGGS